MNSLIHPTAAKVFLVSMTSPLSHNKPVVIWELDTTSKDITLAVSTHLLNYTVHLFVLSNYIPEVQNGVCCQKHEHRSIQYQLTSRAG